MSQTILFPPASQLFFQMAFSPLIATKSCFAARSLSRSQAVTSISEFSLKRRAVDFITAKASGSTSIRACSISSSTLFVSLSTSVASASFSVTSIMTSSSLDLSSFFRPSSSAILSAITPLSLKVSCLSSSLVSLSILWYAS